MNNNISLEAVNIGKYYVPDKYIFQDVNLNLKSANSLIIKGKNGSGKTTLLKILSGIIKPSRGKFNITYNQIPVIKDNIYKYVAYVAPYLNLYDEFSPMELYNIWCNLKSINSSEDKFIELLRQFNIFRQKDNLIGTFSSGMKQKLKYCLAFSNFFPILFIDEPYTNLDYDGIGILKNLIKTQLDNQGIIIIASNDDREYSLGNKNFSLSES